jgi:2-polyprenyl-6-methoxyphenol hydroxylase-like FAD-dependent oxidoreductase
MAALAALRLDGAVRAAGYQTVTAGFQDPNGRWLMRIPDTGSDGGWSRFGDRARSSAHCGLARPIRGLVAATPADRLMRHDVYHLAPWPSAYVCGRVVLVGDAAHAALPTAGQGAATALADGVCIGRMIAAPVRAGGDMAAALTAFDQARRPRCERIARTAAMIARIGPISAAAGARRCATLSCESRPLGLSSRRERQSCAGRPFDWLLEPRPVPGSAQHDPERHEWLTREPCGFLAPAPALT